MERRQQAEEFQLRVTDRSWSPLFTCGAMLTCLPLSIEALKAGDIVVVGQEGQLYRVLRRARCGQAMVQASGPLGPCWLEIGELRGRVIRCQQKHGTWDLEQFRLRRLNRWISGYWRFMAQFPLARFSRIRAWVNLLPLALTRHFLRRWKTPGQAPSQLNRNFALPGAGTAPAPAQEPRPSSRSQSLSFSSSPQPRARVSTSQPPWSLRFLPRRVPQGKRNRRSAARPWLVSLFLHGLLVFVLLVTQMFPWRVILEVTEADSPYRIEFTTVATRPILPTPKEDTPAEFRASEPDWEDLLPDALHSFPSVKEAFPVVEKENVRKLLEEQMAQAQKIEDKAASLQKLIGLQAQATSLAGQNEVLETLGANFQAQDFQPREPPPAGEFDWDDFTMLRMERLDPQGYRITFVDRAGRTAQQTFVGKEAVEFDPLYPLFQTAQKATAFRLLLEYTLKTVAPLVKDAHR